MRRMYASGGRITSIPLWLAVPYTSEESGPAGGAGMGVICNKDGAAVVGDRQAVAQRDPVVGVDDTNVSRDVVKSRGSEDLDAAASTMDVITTIDGRDVMASTSGGKATETGSRREDIPMMNGGEDPNGASDEEGVATDTSSDDTDLSSGQDLPGPTGSQDLAVINTSKDLVTNSTEQDPPVSISQDSATSDPSPSSAVTSTRQELDTSSTRQDLPDNNTSHVLSTTNTTTAINRSHNAPTATAKLLPVLSWSDWDSDDDDDDDEEEPEPEHTKKEEEEEVVWLTQVEDKEAYLRVMAPQYLCLALRSATPLQETHVKLAVMHLCRRWPWLRLRVKLRDQEKQRTPWLCILPRQPFHFQTADEDDSKWSIMESAQGRHRCLRGGPLCTVTLLRESSESSRSSANSSASDVTTDSTSATSGNSCTSTRTSNATDHTSTVSGNVDLASTADGIVADSSTSDSNVNPPSTAGGSVDPSSTTGGSVDPSSTTGENVDPSSTTGGSVDSSSSAGGSVDPSSTTGGSVDPSSTTGGSVDPSSTTGGNVDLSSTTGGSVDPSSTTGGSVDPSSTTGGSVDPSSTTGGSVDPSSTAGGSVDATGVSGNNPAFRHKCQLLLGVPKPFVDEASSVVICDTFVKVLDDLLAERTFNECVQDSPELSPEAETQELTDSQTSEFDEQIQLIQNLRSYSPVRYDNTDILAGGYNGEENEVEENGYIRRNIEPLISRNFLNKCKAERVTYISGFTTCVSAAAMNLLVEAGADPESGVIDVSHRVYVHYRWPEPPYEWQDNDGDDDSDSEVTQSRPGITISASPRDWNTKFWTTVNTVNKKQWENRRGKRRCLAQKIPHNLETEDDGEVQYSPPRYPDVNLCLSDVSIRDSAEFCRCGERLEATSLHTLSPLRHFLLTLNINLQVREDLQNLRFYLNHSTLFVPAATGRRFADEIESVMKSSLKYR